MNNSRRKITLISVAFVSLVVAGCGGGSSGDGGGSGSSSAGSGTLGAYLTDAPACGFDAVNVTVDKLRVHQSNTAGENDGGWSDITLNPARKINLLNLTNGILENLGQAALPAGHYTQLRLVLDGNTGSTTANSVVLSGATTEIALDTPSGAKSGIKLVNEFDVPSGGHVDLVLDFDACKSVVVRGNGSYLLKPVIKVVPTVLNGIDGFVNTALLGSNVMVSAQVNGSVIRSTTPNTQTGEFLLARLAPGNYDVVITADGRATAVIADVPVSSTTSTVMVSTNAAPVTLPASTTRTISGTVTLNPASSTEVSFVATKQTFGSSPTVTVKSQGASLLTGAYSFTLPIGSPLLGQYGAGTLPITFVSQAVPAGKYAAEASATGYQTQSVSKNISAADAIQNFTLTP